MEAGPSVTLSHCDWQPSDGASPAPATLHYGETGFCIQVFSCKPKYKVMFSYEVH